MVNFCVFYIYDNFDECMYCLNFNMVLVDVVKFLVLWDLLIDGEDDSFDEEESEDEGYG